MQTDWINGGDGDDTIFGRVTEMIPLREMSEGQDGDDTFHGGEGDDVPQGGDGRDNLYGDAGNDTLRGGEGDDVLDGGDGSDTADYSTATDTITVDLNAGGEVEDDHSDDDTLRSIENVIGGAGNDVLTGNDNDNTLTGGAGDDTIDGGAGDDTIDPGGGRPTLGRLKVGKATIPWWLALMLQPFSLLRGGAIDDNSSGFENLSGGNNLTGNAGDNVLDGKGGDEHYS